MTCLITSRVSAPCEVCREYPDQVHVQDNGRMYCEDHCPLCRCGVPLAGDVVTIRGKQEDLFA